MYASSTSELQSEFSENVLRLRLNRPAQYNALTYGMIMALLDLLEAAGSDWKVRVVVIEGAGEDLCIGDDPDSMGDYPDHLRHRRPGGPHGPAPLPQQMLFKTLRHLPKPTVCLMTGRVMDSGVDLACASDIRLAAENTCIADTRVLKAQHTATGLTYILPRLLGQSQAMRILLKGEEIQGKEAERIGLAYRAFDSDEFAAASEEIVAQVAAMPTRSYALIKQQIQEQLDMSYDTALMHSLAVRQTNVIEDIAEGTQAFREKREPVFRGR